MKIKNKVETLNLEQELEVIMGEETNTWDVAIIKRNISDKKLIGTALMTLDKEEFKSLKEYINSFKLD